MAGIAALMLSANPRLKATEVKALLQSSADKITDAGTDPMTGHAFGSCDARGHSRWFGHGKVNAAQTVAAAAALEPRRSKAHQNLQPKPA